MRALSVSGFVCRMEESPYINFAISWLPLIMIAPEKTLCSLCTHVILYSFAQKCFGRHSMDSEEPEDHRRESRDSILFFPSKPGWLLSYQRAGRAAVAGF